MLLTIYTGILRGPQKDPSKILVDCYTPDQERAQNLIDQGISSSMNPRGELLILIPFKDKWPLTHTCLVTLARQSLPPEMTMRTVLVDNRSVEPSTLRAVATAAHQFPTLNIQNIKADYDFNFSRINNECFNIFRTQETKWVLFLNNDVELHEPTILSRMTLYLEAIPEAGVVGCTLLYPDRKIQHLFAGPGVKIIAAHPLKKTPYNPTMEWFAKPARPVAAISGAVMMIRSDDFERVGKFDEKLPTLGQDIILSLAVQEKLSRFNIVVNSGDIFHHESLTKAPVFPKSEVRYIYKQYGHSLLSTKYYSKSISRWSEHPLRAAPLEPKYPAQTVILYWRQPTV